MRPPEIIVLFPLTAPRDAQVAQHLVQLLHYGRALTGRRKPESPPSEMGRGMRRFVWIH